MKKQTIKILIFFFIFIFFLTVKTFSLFSVAYKVSINNNFVGYYYNHEEYEKMLEEIKNNNTQEDLESYSSIQQEPQFEKIIIRKSFIKKYNKKDLITPFIVKNYIFYEINYNNKLYYFKNNEEAEKFKNQLLEQNKQISISINKINSNNIDLLTTEEEINETINNLKEEKKKITSRSSITSRTNNYVANTSKILEKYTYISSYYRTAQRPNHTGVDFAAPYGTEVYSWKTGIVELANWDGSYGKMVIVNHGNGQKSRYAHLSSISCFKGQTVKVGQLIGKVGSTGNSTGNHLHFEILINDIFVNPLNYYKN